MKTIVTVMCFWGILYINMQSAFAAETQNPCEDPMYLSLKGTNIDRMSEREYEMYKRSDTACKNYTETMTAADKFAINEWWLIGPAVLLLVLAL